MAIATRIGTSDNAKKRQMGAPMFVLSAILVVATFFLQTAAAQTPPPNTPFVVNPSPDPAGQDLTAPQAASPYRLALLIPFPTDPYWQGVRTAAIDRAAVVGVALEIHELTEPSVPEQLQQIEMAIQSGVDGIILGPVDAYGIVPGLARANAASVPVLVLDTAPIAGEVISFVRTDNEAAALLAGRYIGSELEGEGTVLNIQGDLSNPVAQQRDLGLREGLGAYSAVDLVSGEGNWNSGSAFSLTLEQLPVADEGTPAPPVPLVDAVFGASPAMTIGASSAVEGLEADTVGVYGFGATEETLQGIRDGTIRAVVAEFPARAALLAVDTMVRYLNGVPVPQFVDSGFTLVTIDNLGDLQSFLS